jgi:hypothetical protein
LYLLYQYGGQEQKSQADAYCEPGSNGPKIWVEVAAVFKNNGCQSLLEYSELSDAYVNTSLTHADIVKQYNEVYYRLKKATFEYRVANRREVAMMGEVLDFKQEYASVLSEKHGTSKDNYRKSPAKHGNCIG